MLKMKKEYEVTILSRREITVYPEPNKPVKQILVTYVTPGLPPSTITIDKSKWTPDNEKRLIRADIEERMKWKPETYKV